jgi:hypothetical protein
MKENEMTILMDTKKRIAKLENYWFSSSFFRDKMYHSLSSCTFFDFAVYTQDAKSLKDNFPDLGLSYNEVSLFLSGLYFNSSSRYVKYDPDCEHLSSAEIKEKNSSFNDLGSKLSAHSAIIELFRLKYLKEDFSRSNRENLFQKLEIKFPKLEQMHLNYFIFGSNGDKFYSGSQTEKLFLLAGNDSRNEKLLTYLNNKNVFEIFEKKMKR